MWCGCGVEMKWIWCGSSVDLFGCGVDVKWMWCGCLFHNVCAGNRFGAYLVSRGLSEVGDIITVFFSILIGAFYLGQVGPNAQKLAEAQAAAAVIYNTIDRVRVVSYTVVC